MRRVFAGAVASLMFGVAPLAAQGTPPRTDSARKTLEREVFTYSAGGRRDPMMSLAGSGDIRPLFAELELVAIIFDESGSNHTALLRNIGGSKEKGKQYRIKVGQMVGRMRVTQITRKEVVFTLDEFGFSRQQRLSVKPDTIARTP